MRALVKIIIATCTIISFNLAKAGPDEAPLCERNIILSSYFTPNFWAETAYVAKVYEYRFYHCTSRDGQFYMQYQLPEWPLEANAVPEMIDVNAVSILGIEKDYVDSSGSSLVLLLNDKHIAKMLQETHLVHRYTPEKISTEIIQILNLIFATAKQATEKNAELRLFVKTNAAALKQLGFTDSVLSQLNGQWLFE